MRIRSTALTAVLGLALLSAAACAPPAPPRAVAQADSISTPLTRVEPVDSVSITAVPAFAFTLATVDSSVPAVAQATATARHDAPAPSPRPPLSPLIAFAAVGATKRKATRRAKNGTSKVKLFLDSTVHLMRDGVDGPMTEIVGGVLVDDTDLEDDEIEELQKLGAIRYARPEEIARLEVAGDAAAMNELQQAHVVEMDELKAKQAAELDGKSADQQAKLVPKHAEQIAALQAKQAKELGA